MTEITPPDRCNPGLVPGLPVLSPSLLCSCLLWARLMEASLPWGASHACPDFLLVSRAPQSSTFPPVRVGKPQGSCCLPQTSATCPVSCTSLKGFRPLVRTWLGMPHFLYPPEPVQGSHCAGLVSSHTWNSWQCGWLAPGNLGPHSGVGGSRRLAPDTGKSLSRPHLSGHMVAMVTTGQRPHPESHSAPADTHRGRTLSNRQG